MASSNISLDNSKLLSHHSGPMSPATSPVSHFRWPQMMPSAMVRWAQPEWFANFFFQGKWREWTWHEGIVSLKPTEVSECGRPGNRSIRSISKQWVYNYSKTGGLCHGVHPAFIGALFLWCPSVHFPVPCWSRGQDSAPIGGWNQLLLTFLNL